LNFLIFIRLLRPHQWIKNLFVFAGLFFAHAWVDLRLVESALIVFMAFCFMSSSVYIYNDLIDYPQDRLHPVKRHRLLASQKISLSIARVTTLLLLIAALTLALTASYPVAIIILSYFCLNIVYTHYLKHVVILDVFAISAGFMLRILAGTTGLHIPPSPWLMFCGFMITLFLGFTKRRAEGFVLEETHFSSRPVLKEYNTIFLDKMIGITASCSIIGYGLYTLSPETIRVHHTTNLIYTIPFVIYGIFRYIYLLHQKAAQSRGEDTSKDLFTDLPLIMTVLLWGGVTFYLIS
jgi:4-hydroxybenzoate polyprenyltransferase